ncbi:MAG TPA: O-antigen ligase family protein [Terriglobales bacterium]
MEIAEKTLRGCAVTLAPDKLQSPILVIPRGSEETRTGLWDASRVLLLALLMVAPLLFGAVQPWAWGGLTIVAACLLLLWGVGCVRAGSVRLTWSPLYLPLMALLVLAAVQLWSGLSIDHVGTREALIKLVTYAILFFVGQLLYASASARAWQISGATVAIYVFLMALFAIVQFFASPGLLYGVFPAESTAVFGPYVNRGNYAGLMEMLIPVAMTLAISLRWRHPAKPFLLFVVFVALVSVFLSGSRAGLISLAVEFGLVGLVLLFTGSEQKHVLVVGIVVAALAFGFFYWLDPGDVWGRWWQVASKPELALGSRDKIAADSLRMSRDHLAYGVGLGAFETAYTPYQTVVTDLTIDYAHNDYVQFLAEAGIWGWILTPISIAMFLVLSFRHLPSRLRQQSGWLQFGAAVGVCGLLVHSFSEFNLHIPANAAWFTFLAALATLPGMRLRRG